MAFRSAFRSARPTIGRQPQVFRHTVRRGYAAHGHAEKSSDAPWAIGAVVVTIPTCWFLLQSSPEEAHHPHAPHAPGGHASSHKEEKEHVEEEKTEKAEPAEEKPEEKEEKKEEAPAEAADEKSSSDSKDEVASDAAAPGEEGLKSENKEYVGENLEKKDDQEKEIPTKKKATDADPSEAEEKK
ncbi:hypothetical protein DH86_00001740 [Scytalidium sp. 3C]|nr:hypothetical protein DH86_00001740 [Scytalidium sp. 3C]